MYLAVKSQKTEFFKCCGCEDFLKFDLMLFLYNQKTSSFYKLVQSGFVYSTGKNSFKKLKALNFSNIYFL